MLARITLLVRQFKRCRRSVGLFALVRIGQGKLLRLLQQAIMNTLLARHRMKRWPHNVTWLA